MKNAADQQLRKLALILTAVLVLQLSWSALRVLLTSEPVPILPAEASLRVDDRLHVEPLDEELSQALVSRPLFWLGRQAYVADTPGEIEKTVSARGSGAISQVVLQGMYTGSTPGIIISAGGERRRVRQGESVEGWEFVQLLPDGAVFRRGEDEVTLKLEHAFSVPQDTGADESSAGERDLRVSGGEPDSNEHNETTGE